MASVNLQNESRVRIFVQVDARSVNAQRDGSILVIGVIVMWHGREHGNGEINRSRERQAREFLNLSGLLVLPETLIQSALEEKREQEVQEIQELRREAKQIIDELADEEECVIEKEPSAPVCDAASAEETPLVRVFSPEQVSEVKRHKSSGDRDDKSRMDHLVKLMEREGGLREIADGPDFALLRAEFPHFREAIDVLQAEFTLAKSGDPLNWFVSPVLLNGPPGVGKTMFVERLAELMDVRFAKVNVGAAQGGFEIAGTSRHWANTKPGRVFDILAFGRHANPVLLLDELDKAATDDRNPIEPILLDLLETRTAAHFRDDCLAASFDASKIVILATSNELHRVSDTIKSRLQVAEVPPPSREQLREIALTIVESLCGKLPANRIVDVSDAAIDQLAGSGLSPREMARVVRRAFGQALINQLSVIDHFPIESTGKTGIGFLG